MQRSEALMAIARIQVIWPNQALEEPTINEYVSTIEDLEPLQVAAGLETLKLTSTFRPSMSDLRRACLDAIPSNRVPDVDEAWTEITTNVQRLGRYRGKDIGLHKGLGWSHKAIAEAVVSMGWDNICDSTNLVADRAHFFTLYGNSAARAQRETVMTPLGRQLTDQLTQGIGRSLPELTP